MQQAARVVYAGIVDKKSRADHGATFSFTSKHFSGMTPAEG
jgi:hypothetical protein